MQEDAYLPLSMASAGHAAAGPISSGGQGISAEARARTLAMEISAARRAGDHERAVAIGHQLWTDFAGDDDVLVARQVATGVVYMGISLFRTNRLPEARSTFEAVVRRYAMMADPEMQRIVHDARDMARQ